MASQTTSRYAVFLLRWPSPPLSGTPEALGSDLTHICESIRFLIVFSRYVGEPHQHRSPHVVHSSLFPLRIRILSNTGPFRITNSNHNSLSTGELRQIHQIYSNVEINQSALFDLSHNDPTKFFLLTVSTVFSSFLTKVHASNYNARLVSNEDHWLLRLNYSVVIYLESSYFVYQTDNDERQKVRSISLAIDHQFHYSATPSSCSPMSVSMLPISF